jgi:DNA-binding NtrC family response regulator
MKSLTVVVAHADRLEAQQLAHSLSAHFVRMTIADNPATMREAIERNRTNLAIVDLDMVPVDQIKQICSDYAGIGVVCVHRAPDYEMWDAAIKAGALECCHPSDIPAILNAMRSRPSAKSRAVAA